MQTWNPLLDYLFEVVTLKNVIIFSVLYFFVIWISLLAWVIRDITNRTDRVYLQIISILTILLFTPLWIFLYLLIRPSKTLFEQYYTEVEDNLDCLWADIIEKIWKDKFDIIKCDKCEAEIMSDFKYCPYCKSKVNAPKKEVNKTSKPKKITTKK